MNNEKITKNLSNQILLSNEILISIFYEGLAVFLSYTFYVTDSGSHDGVMHSPAGRRLKQQSFDSTSFPEKIREGRGGDGYTHPVKTRLDRITGYMCVLPNCNAISCDFVHLTA